MYAMASVPLLCIASCLCLAPLLALAERGRYYDELLWSKQYWPEYKLDFPYYSLLKLDRGFLETYEESLKGGVFESTSLGGGVDDPLGFLETEASRENEDRVEVQIGALGSVGPSKYSLPASITHQLVSCDVYQALGMVLWPIVANWTQHVGNRLSDEMLIDVGKDVCQVEAPVLVLKDWTLVQAVVTKKEEESPMVLGGIQGLIGMPEQYTSQYVMMMKRFSQNALQQEFQVVRKACEDIIETDEWRQRMLKHQETYLDLVLSEMSFPSGRKERNSLGQIALHPNRECADFHPQCSFWAQHGECNANPRYMVGTSKTGQCRKSCHVCEENKFSLPAHISAKLAQLMEDTFTDISSDMLAYECPLHKKDNVFFFAKEEFAFDLKKSDTSDRFLSQIHEVIGPIRVKEISFQRTTEISPNVANLQQTTVTDHNNAVVKLERSDEDLENLIKPNSTSPDTMKALWDLLQDRCLYCDQGYWRYQLCHGSSIFQYHIEHGSAEPEWIISLGTLKDPSWNISLIPSATLYDAESSVPAVANTYTDGNECTIGDDYNPEKDAGHPENRLSVVYYLCSPDEAIHMFVAEKSRCVYTIEVYLPGICEVEGLNMKVEREFDKDSVEKDDNIQKEEEEKPKAEEDSSQPSEEKPEHAEL